LRRRRRAAAVDVYRGLCLLETDRGFAAGAPLLLSYQLLAERTGRCHQHIGDNLCELYTCGLLTEFERGSGSGPHARDRRASKVRRKVPIPPPPADAYYPHTKQVASRDPK
jgi:hypothetical protein